MSPEVSKLIYEAAIKAGDELKGKLPPHPFHPKGRNSHAHVFESSHTLAWGRGQAWGVGGDGVGDVGRLGSRGPGWIAVSGSLRDVDI